MMFGNKRSQLISEICDAANELDETHARPLAGTLILVVARGRALILSVFLPDESPSDKSLDSLEPFEDAGADVAAVSTPEQALDRARRAAADQDRLRALDPDRRPDQRLGGLLG